MEVEDLDLFAAAAVGVKLEEVWAGGRRWGREQPRQSRVGSVLPDGPGAVSETGRYTQGTGVVTPLEPLASSNPVDSGWIAVRIRPSWRAGNSGQGIQGLGPEATVNCLRQ